MLYLEKLVDSNEQYSRRDCLVLSREDLPQPSESEPGVPEGPAKTKEVVEDVTKINLG